MIGLLRRFSPAVGSVPKDKEEHGDYSIEYSFALEYRGPPPFYDIPQATPVNVDEIPTAATAALESVFQDMSLPIIQPFRKRDTRKQMPVEPVVTGETEVFFSAYSIEPSADCVRADPSKLLNGSNISRKSSGVADSFRSYGNEDASLATESTILAETEITEESEDVPLPKLPGDWVEADGDSVDSTPCRLSNAGEMSQIGEEPHDEMPRHVKRMSVVTFDSDSADTFEEESIDEVDIFPVKQRAEKIGKQGACYRCLKGNRLTEKEACIVCDAKYCQNCTLRVMGSMPEGRKCIPCIGFRIDEQKRSRLGKCSRILKRLLPESEVEWIMSLEMSCQANQIPPNLVYVNDRPLRQEELLCLQSCANPPKKLRPGNYWYDKVAGLWGKQGQKPCQIISAELNIGGKIKKEASNGNTNVLINGREVTKDEVWMLKSAGIQCEDKPHLWVGPDGSYQEEGQKDAKGRIWEKTKTKVVCRLLFLPFPADCANPRGEEVDRKNVDQNVLHKLLLVGFDKSGTSTIFKQAKILYDIPFTEDERHNLKLVIQINLYYYLGILLEGRERFEEESLKGKGKILSVDQPTPSGCGSFPNGSSREKEKRLIINEYCPSDKMNQKPDQLIYSMSGKEELKAFSDWLLNVIASGNLEAVLLSASLDYSSLVEELWKDEAIQATYNRRDELEKLPRLATYFLERAPEISKEEYEPSDMDIVYAEGITSSNGLASMEFQFPESTELDEPRRLTDKHCNLQRYQLIRVHPRSLGENCKWLEMFEDINLVVFCVSLTDYDEFCEDSRGSLINKMMASKQLFESIVTHPTVYKKDFLLILNKFDLLEEKIEQVPLNQCEWFRDFHPVISHNHNTGINVNPVASLAQRAFHHIAVQFKRLFHSLTGRKLFVSFTTGLEQDSVDEALKYAREIINWDKEEITFIHDESSASLDASTS